MAVSPDELWITLGLNVVSGVIMLAGGVFVLVQGWKRAVNQLFFFLTFSTLVYTALFIVAALQTTYAAAYFWWSLNIFDILITISVVHFIFTIAGRARAWRWFIVLTYALGAAIFVAALIHPAWFLPRVVPKLYFPYYLDGGWLYGVMLAYFLIMPLFAAANLLSTYRRSVGVEQKRLEYFILMLIVGYGIGCLNFLLVFNIRFDPIYGSLLGLYYVPIAYGIVATDLLDIRLVLRRALFYAIGIGAIAAFLTALIFLNGFLVAAIPGFQFWAVPAATAIVAFVVGRTVLKQINEAERLKYEFITVITHKLRTPLTRIRWTIPELLASAGDNQAVREGLAHIDEANSRLIELTNILLEAAHPGGTYAYERKPVDLVAVAKATIERFRSQAVEKKLGLALEAPPELWALGDARRAAMAVEVFIENAITYTPSGGDIRAQVAPGGQGVRFSVADTGVGVDKADQRDIFKTFFRTEAARAADTEGVGLGLSLVKNTIERQGGTVGVLSEGSGKGSTFWFTLPAAPIPPPASP